MIKIKNMKLTNQKKIKSILASMVLFVGLSAQASGITYFLNENTKPNFEIKNISTSKFLVENIYPSDGNPITDKLFENEKISISTAYPNPAVENVSFNYKLSSLAGNAKITLSDVFGNKIGAYELSHEQTRLRISVQDLPESIYFYTLHVDGKVVITKKLVVRR